MSISLNRQKLKAVLEELQAKQIWNRSTINHIQLAILSHTKMFLKHATTKQITFRHFSGMPEKKVQVFVGLTRITFLNLIRLELQDNNICNIESLSKLKANNLAVLKLDYNRIVRVRVLRKCYFPKLQQLSLVNNPVTDLQTLNEANFCLLLELTLQQYDTKVISEDIRWLFKSRSPNLQQVIMTGTKRIIQGNCKQMMKEYLPELYLEVDQNNEEHLS